MKEKKRKIKKKNGIVIFDKAIKNGEGYLFTFCCMGPYMPTRGGW